MRFLRILRAVWWKVAAESRIKIRRENHIEPRPDPATVDYEVADEYAFGTWVKKDQDYARKVQKEAQELARIFRDGTAALKRIQLEQEKKARRQARRDFWRSIRLFCKRVIGLA